jgi:hypothetical protein
MAGTSNVVRIRIVGDAKSLQKATDDAAGAIGKLEGSGSRLSGVLAGAFTTAAILGFAKSSVKAASDIEEALNKIRVLVGDSIGEVSNWSKTTASSFGISRRAALEYVGTFANLLDKLGKTGDETAMMSQRLTELAADLASFSNTPVSQALTAIQSGLQGQARPLRQYGVLLSDAVLKERAMSMGLRETTKGVLPPLIRMEAAYAEILAQTTKAQGDFKRTASSTANQAKTLSAQFDDLRVAIGEGLNPVAKGFLRTVAEWLPALQGVGSAIVGLAKSAGLANDNFLPMLASLVAFRSTLGLVRAAAGGLSTVMGGLSVATLATQGPLVLITGALVAAGAAFLVYQKRQADAKKAAEGMAEALLAANDPLGVALDKAKKLSEALKGFKDGTDGAAQSVVAMDAAFASSIAERDKTIKQFNQLGISAEQLLNAGKDSGGALKAGLDAAFQMVSTMEGGSFAANATAQLKAYKAQIGEVNTETEQMVLRLFELQDSGGLTNDQLRALLTTLNNVKNAYGKNAEEIVNLTDKNVQAALNVGVINQAWIDQRNAMYGTLAPAERAIKIQTDLTAEYDRQAVEAKNAAAAAKRLAGEHGWLAERSNYLQSQIEELTEAYQKEQDALLATVDAEFAATSAKRKAAESNDDLAEKTAELAEATKQYGAGSKEAKDAQKAYNDAVESSISDSKAAALAVKSMMERQNESGEANYSATEIQAEYIRTLHELAAAATDPAVKAALEGIATRFEENAKKADTAAKKINDYIGALNGVKAQEKIAALAELGIGVPVPGKAVGGPVQAGQPYLVGEQGPELFMPQRSGTIIPNGALAAAGQGGGVTIVVNSPLGRPDDVVRWMREELRRLDRGQR